MGERAAYRISVPRLLKTWLINLANGATLLLTRGRRVLHEGTYRNGRWSDWARAFSCRPKAYERPVSEDEICRIVRSASRLRVVGAGHSFNAAALSDETLMSLDAYGRLELLAHPDKKGWAVAKVQAGIRLRDFTRRLHEAGYAMSVAGSTDAQSIGGLIATDLHGTGRDHGFLSEAILSVRVIDAHGIARTVRPGDDVYHAAIGGAGTCGVVVEAEIECEPAYNLAKSVKLVKREWAEANLEALLAENTHLSFYYFGGFARSIDQEDRQHLSYVRMHKWNRTVDEPNRLLGASTLADELFDLGFPGFLFDFARLAHLTAPLARVSFWLYGLFTNQRQLVYPAYLGFSRTLYFRHDEIEYGVPYETHQACLREIRELLIRRRYPSIIEVRFTDDSSRGLLGPGAGRRTVHLELAPSMSRPTDPIFEEFEKVVLSYGGQPHLGKKMYFPPGRLAGIHPAERVARFHAARTRQDPEGKFWNVFCARYLAESSEGSEAERRGAAVARA